MDHYAVFGNPIKQSKSPLIHTMFAAQTGQSLEYSRVQPDSNSFKTAMSQFFAEGAKGANVTAPFKLEAFQFANTLSKRAQIAGAVNTLQKLLDGSVFGDNTDGPGLVQDLLRLNIELKNKRILLLGAGGAARGVLQPLLDEQPATVLIANRTLSKAQQLAALIPTNTLQGCGFENLTANTPSFDLIINSTSASLTAELPAVSECVIAAATHVYDMSYSDKPTVFMKHASNLGVEHIFDGLGMLVGQAAESFFIWRGVRPLVEPVIQTLRAKL
jgi:shikimate dehydrogenase